MATAHSQKSKDVLFLMTVRLENENLSAGKIRMLYCDTTGKVYASIMNKTVYGLSEDSTKRLE